MADVVRRLKSLSRYCDQLSGDLLDPGMRKRFSEAARYFQHQADALLDADGADDPSFAARPFPPREDP